MQALKFTACGILRAAGLSSGLIEIAEAAGIRQRIEEACIPVREEVTGACEVLGLDPLYLANEGRFIVFVPRARSRTAPRHLAKIRGEP